MIKEGVIILSEKEDHEKEGFINLSRKLVINIEIKT